MAENTRRLALTADVSYEIDLEDEPQPGPAIPVDPPPPDITRRPLIPPQPADLLVRAARLQVYRAAWHTLRSPRYLLLTVAWSLVGAIKMVAALAWWWSVQDGRILAREARKAGDDKAWKSAHETVRKSSSERATIVGGVAATAAVTLAVGWRFGHWLILAPLVVVVPLLARAGRPADRPIITPAVVTPRWRKLNADIVLRAYYAAGLGHPDKPGQQVTFGSTMARDGEGTRVDVDLPHGKGLKDAVDAKDKIASGLDVTESQVFIRRDPTSYRRHTLWVADRDPLAVPVGRTPLLACRPTDIWKSAPLGLDERGQVVTVPLIWNSLLVSALPRQGKTFSARSLALFAALDPYVKLDVFDFKGSPDWRKFALVAHRAGFGLTMNRHGDPLQMFGEALEEIKADVQDRNHRLSELADRHPELCPEGKLTRRLARDPRFAMPVRMLVMDEFQEVYDLGDASKDVAQLLTFLVKIAPSAGVILLDSTQRPSGVGTGQVAQQFTSFRDNHAIRFGLRTSSWQVSELCLGAGAYSEGLDTSTLLPQYKGVGILRGATDASPTVRTYLADGKDAERILLAARALRERAGTLSGMAAGDTVTQEARDVLGDVLAVFGGDPSLHWKTLAGRLAAAFPDRWADADGDAVSAQCRAVGVPSKVVTATGERARGCYLRDVQEAAGK